jgi:hypothetical protein
MSIKAKSAGRHAANQKVSYALLAGFSDLLICSRCLKQNIRKPVRQLMSVHHRPLALCHECSHEVHNDHQAAVLKFN